MMGSGRTNEKDKPPASANPLILANDDYAKSIAPNLHAARSVIFREGNVAGGHFESVPDMPLPIAPAWDNMYLMNQPIAQGIPETSGNPMASFMNPNSFQNPQINLSSNTANTYLPEVPLLPEWNMRWSPQFINQGNNAISAGGMNDGAGISNFENPWSSKNSTIARNFAGDCQMSRQGGESKFEPFNRPQVNGDIVGSSFLFHPRDTAPVHIRNSVNFNTSQCGVQGKVEGSFLSLGIGGTEEAIPRSQPGSREISDRLKEAAMGQTLDTGFMGFQRNTSGFSNQLCHVDRMTSTNNEVGVHSTPNSRPGSSPYQILQMQQNDMQHAISRHDDGNSNFSSSRNIRYGDLDHYRAFVGNQAAHSGTLRGNSAQFFNSQLYDLNRLAPEFAKPSWMASHTPSGQLQNIRIKTANSQPSECSMNSPSLGLGSCSTLQNYAGQQLLSHNGMLSQGLGGVPLAGQQLLSHDGMLSQGLGGSLFPHRITMSQVARVSSTQASTDAPFPKRLGMEFNARDSPRAAERHLSLKGTSMQTTSTGQMFPDKGSTCLPGLFLRPSIGQSQDALIQFPKNPQGAASTNASTVDGLSQKSDFHIRPYLKRPAVAPPPASLWVQRQKRTHPTIHPSMPIPFPTKPAIPVTTALVHPSIPVASQTEPIGPVAPPIHPSIPCTSHFKPHVPVTTPPIVSHISWKGPDRTPHLTGNKCFLCKRDLSLTSEGAVYQPMTPPAVAVLPCGHTFHDQCLQNITPQDQSNDPPCIPCVIGDN